jgi:NADP-dependent 3-hydroxy acid dehydrogenase YdfG
MKDQHYLITGITSGIGYATAQAFLANGALVSGIARDYSTFDLKTEATESIDLADLDLLAENLKQKAIFKTDYDGLILNAGIGRFGTLEQFSNAQIQSMVNTNLTSNLMLLRHFLPQLKAKKKGDIVLIGSESALQGGPMGAVYSATKFAVRGLTQSLRHECSASNVRVILINPGPVRTSFFDELNFQPAEGDSSALSAEDVASSIMSALSTPSHVVTEEINLQVPKRVFQKK